MSATQSHAETPTRAEPETLAHDADLGSSEEEPRRPWLTAALALGLGALVVFAVVALVVPQHLTDPSGRRAKVYAISQLARPADITVDRSSQVRVFRLTVPPGKDVGWHEHRGYSLVSVVAGQATFYDRDDSRCRPHRFDPGESELEHPDHPHDVRNEGTVPLVMVVVDITAQGKNPDRNVTANPECHS